MAIRASCQAALLAAALGLAGCGDDAAGPIRVSAIGAPPAIANPNLQPLDAPSAFLTEAAAQGLVHFDAAGEIEPALAQSWVVSNDGLRYTFRIRPAQWAGGAPVTAQQVALRLRATLSRASRNPLKPVLGAVAAITPMTDRVLEISLHGARPNFLQLLAQPEMAILQGNVGTGPYRVADSNLGEVRLALPRGEDEEIARESPDVELRGEGGAMAVARFAEGRADLVLGGTGGDLAFARAANLAASRLVFDPVNGLFGLAFTSTLGDPATRRALAMAIDRDALAAAIGAPRLAGRAAIVPAGILDLPAPAQPDWAALPIDARRSRAAQSLAELPAPLRLRVAMPSGPGYRLVFAHLRRDWRMIGVEAEAVAPGAPADLILIDQVAPANLASWYLRHFACDASAICDPAADQALLAARAAPNPAERQAHFAEADRILTELAPFIALTAPVRWSLVSPRLTGFRPNPFARHQVTTLIAERE
ncbi:MAG TPA: ABC transporter substrate-binding protein [Allosphingosinicella sp.]|nr:ABC transporter substrate-binding protein [Allosphingosinicella sp.]